jgi:large subunit ribosomal protein L3
MGNIRKPRCGSMQFWHRKRAKSEVPRIRFWAPSKDAKMLGFAGYKVGMTHITFEDTRDRSLTKGKVISWPATIVECPPLTVFSVKFYKDHNSYTQVFADKLDKYLDRSMKIPKSKKSINDIKDTDFEDLKLVVHANPSLTTIGKKKPEVFEVALGGKKEDKLKAAKDMLGKEVKVKDIFRIGQLVDTHAITTGKGLAGPVKRFGVSIRRHKSEKVKRGPGSLGGWRAQGHTMYRVAHAGKMGYNQRVEYNKQILKIDDKIENINPKSGFKHYGVVRNPYILLKGSIAGPTKRFVKITQPIRPDKMIKEIDFNVKVIQ